MTPYLHLSRVFFFARQCSPLATHLSSLAPLSLAPSSSPSSTFPSLASLLALQVSAEWSRMEWENLRNMRVFALTSLLRAPPPSDGAELMADPGRLPDSEPEILLVQRQREYWSGTCHSCGWCGLDWGSTRGAALGLNSKSLLSTLLSREWS